MPKTFLKLVIGSVLLIAAQACVPGQPTPDLDTISTAIAQTMTAGPGIPVTGAGSPTFTATLIVIEESPTPQVTTVPPTETMTAIPLFTPTPLLTPGVVQVYVSVPTNCRLGPSVAYTRVGGLQLGEVANVVARNATGDYWVIRNPNRASETCWLWGRYATVVGDTSQLPVFSPPPLPTPVPGFDASLDGLESCTDTDEWWLDMAVENTGGISFRSYFMIVTDAVTGTGRTLYGNNFIDRDGCANQENQGDLDPDDILIVSSPAFDYNPSGNRLSVRLTVCSDINQSGTCLTQNFGVTP